MTNIKLPEEFVARMRGQLGPEANDFFDCLSQDPATSVYLHSLKSKSIYQEMESVPWQRQGRYLPERPSYVADPHYHAGAYYPQEASSMLIEALVKQLNLREAPFCMDLCAAPGGKSINLLEAIGERGFLISNEVIRSRVKILQENIRRWGRHHVAITSAHPEKWKSVEDLFDLVLIDAPCSGEGMFRKEVNAIPEWSMDHVEFCASRQASILENSIPSIKPGGYLIYSTCAYSEAENKDMLAYISSQGLEPVELKLNPEWNLLPIGSYGNAWQAYPHRLKGEGLFISAFKKPGGQEIGITNPSVSMNTKGIFDIAIPDQYEILERDHRYFLKSTGFASQLDYIQSHIGFIESGMELGEVKGKDFIPSHQLAMSGLLASDFQQIDFNYEEAIKFLRKETFVCDIQKNGWYLASFEGTVLGWVKIAAGRMKNHFPKSWMIRKRW